MRPTTAAVAIAFGLAACGHDPSTPAQPPDVWSPDRSKFASTFSIGDAIAGNTQVMVTFGDRGGGGVFAIDRLGVPIRLRWKDNATLVIAYPDRLTPSKQASRTRIHEDVVTVEYETYAGWQPR